MKIGIAKPEWGFRGGFEFVLDRIVDQLEAKGHSIAWLTIDANAAGQPPHAAFGLEIPDDVWTNAVEFFRYVTMVERFAALDASGVDLLLCTQPGSWAVEHPRKLALFYHHLRVFYDLAEVYVDAGYSDPVFHDPCTDEVRAVDAPLLDTVGHFLTPSTEVEARLDRYNGVGDDRRSPFLAGFAFRDGRGSDGRPSDGTGHVLAVSRHEWPKRTELVVAAAHHLRAAGTGVSVKVVGGGGRLDHARAVDARLGRLSGDDLVRDDGRRLWLPATTDRPPPGYRPSANLELLGHIEAAELDRLYADALCVVAPALLEDYGLTAVEAMAYGKPVVVCHDGGGLVDTVTDGENGLVVEASGAAIAAAVQRLRDEPGLAARLSEGARETAARYTWDRAMAQFDVGLERAAS